LEFPTSNDFSVPTFITSLLKKKPTDRLCSLNLLKESPFFTDFNFVYKYLIKNELSEFNIKPLYLPKVHNVDLTNVKLKYLDKLSKVKV
jgi:hypothetical protein